MTKYVGIDISKNYFDAVFDKNGVVKQKRYSYAKESVEAFVAELAEGAHCVMEASGGYHLPLAMALSERGITVSVVNPLVIRRYAQMRMSRAKTDRQDARIILSYAQTQHPKAWRAPAKAVSAMRQISRVLERLQHQIRELRQSEESFSASGMLDATVTASISAAVTALEAEVRVLNTRLLELAQEQFANELEHLESISGMGSTTAIALLLCGDAIEGFRSGKHLASYIGICPRVYESGSSIRGKGHICKMGAGRLRQLLYMCSLSAIRWNLRCRELYERLLAKGKSKKLALIAVAHKLVRQAYAVVTQRCSYAVL